jgi:N-carbamoylputrescine amidase
MKSHPKSVKIALIQDQCSAIPAENLAKAVSHIRAAAAQGAQIICLQELLACLWPKRYRHIPR